MGDHELIEAPTNGPLFDSLPPRARKILYLALTLAALGVTAWQTTAIATGRGTDATWIIFTNAVLSSLGFGLAHNNTITPGK